jgi:hypothetical protein
MSYLNPAKRTGGMYARPALIAMNAVPQRIDNRRNNAPFRYVLIEQEFLAR